MTNPSTLHGVELATTTDRPPDRSSSASLPHQTTPYSEQRRRPRHRLAFARAAAAPGEPPSGGAARASGTRTSFGRGRRRRRGGPVHSWWCEETLFTAPRGRTRRRGGRWWKSCRRRPAYPTRLLCRQRSVRSPMGAGAVRGGEPNHRVLRVGAAFSFLARIPRLAAASLRDGDGTRWQKGPDVRSWSWTCAASMRA